MSRSSWQMLSGAAGLLAAFAAVSVFLLSSTESLHVVGISLLLAITACFLVGFSLAPDESLQNRRSHQHQTR